MSKCGLYPIRYPLVGETVCTSILFIFAVSSRAWRIFWLATLRALWTVWRFMSSFRPMLASVKPSLFRLQILLWFGVR